MIAAYDVEAVRSQFPSLRREVHSRLAAFLDGPAGSQVPQRVIDAVVDYFARHNANTGGEFRTSRESDALIERARERMAAFLGAPSPREIVFGANMTTQAFHLSHSLARSWGPGDEVVVTELDHQANITPWRLAAEDAGATIRSVPFDPETRTLRYDILEKVVGPRTRLVAIGYASNAVGTINDVQRVVALARQAGALSFVDAVHFAPHGITDVEKLECDFLACSAYKFFGPHVGILWGRRALLEEMVPYKVPPASDEVPERWETGTLNHEGIAGTAAAVAWIAELGGSPGGTLREQIVRGMEAIESWEREVFEQLIDGIGRIPGVRSYGPPAGHARTPTLAFTLRGYHPRNIAARLAEEGVFVWSGDFYASTVVAGLGLAEQGGLVRVGLAPYSTPDEVERLLAVVRRIATE